MRIAKAFILPVFVWLLSGCVTTGSSAVKSDDDGHMPQRYTLPSVETQAFTPKEGAIYQAENSLDLYSDHRASRVGDIIMVKIVETSSATKKASTKTARNSTLTGGLGAFFGVEQWLSGRNANFTPSTSNINVTLKNDFDGSGETKRDSTVTASMAARIIEVTLQGNLMVRGYKEVRVNDETQHMIITGLVRPEDISFDNTILSTRIADARIEYSGTGIISEKQQPGWLARGMDFIWPF